MFDSVFDCDRNAYRLEKPKSTCRVEVFFIYHCLGDRYQEQRLMDLQVHCGALEQVKNEFMDMYPRTIKEGEEVIEVQLVGTQEILYDGADMLKNMTEPVITWNEARYPFMLLQFSVRKINEVRKPMISNCAESHVDKQLRFMRNIQISEEQLEIRNLVTEQKKELEEMKKELAELKTWKSEELSRRLHERKEQHNAICDICDENIQGHRFKCVVCPDFDLCADCEGDGEHGHHVMLRIPLATKTFIPDFIEQRINLDRGADLKSTTVKNFELPEKFANLNITEFQDALDEYELKERVRKLDKLQKETMEFYLNKEDSDSDSESISSTESMSVVKIESFVDLEGNEEDLELAEPEDCTSWEQDEW